MQIYWLTLVETLSEMLLGPITPENDDPGPWCVTLPIE